MFYFYVIILQVAIFVSISSSSRVIDRFGGRYRKDLPCRLMNAEEVNTIASLGRVASLRDSYYEMAFKFNCTLMFTPYRGKLYVITVPCLYPML